MQITGVKRWINPQMLIWARDQLGLDPEQASKHATQKAQKVARTSFSIEDLIAWEKGAGEPHVEHLELLAEIYDCPAGYFFLEAPPRQISPRLDFRGLAPDKAQKLSYETRLGLMRFQRLIEYAQRLNEQLELLRQVQIVRASPSNDVQEVVRLASKSLGITQELRSSWTTAVEAFECWRAAIERQGILVFSLKLDSHDVRGASAPEPGLSAILVNHADVEAATGRTFTLLHEYAHLVVKHSGVVCDFRGPRAGVGIETFANRFAAAAIVPKERFLTLLHKKQLHHYRESWGDALLDQLREPFKTSRDVVAILLQDLDLAPPDFYQRKRAAWEKRRPFGRGGRGGGQSLVHRRRRELGFTFSRLLAEAERGGIISRLDVADLLETNIKQANAFIDMFTAHSQGG